MKLIIQPNPWTCLLSSFCMCMKLTIQEGLQTIGHDGSRRLLLNNTNDSVNRSGHHIQEMIDMAFQFDYSCTPIDAKPAFGYFDPNIKDRPELWSNEICEKRIESYLMGNVGVIIGTVGFNQGHAVAWDGKNVYDPRGQILKIEEHEMVMHTFYILRSHCAY